MHVIPHPPAIFAGVQNRRLLASSSGNAEAASVASTQTVAGVFQAPLHWFVPSRSSALESDGTVLKCAPLMLN